MCENFCPHGMQTLNSPGTTDFFKELCANNKVGAEEEVVDCLDLLSRPFLE